MVGCRDPGPERGDDGHERHGSGADRAGVARLLVAGLTA